MRAIDNTFKYVLNKYQLSGDSYFVTGCFYCVIIIVTEGLTIAVAGGVVLGIFAGLTMLITVFFHRHQ